MLSKFGLKSKPVLEAVADSRHLNLNSRVLHKPLVREDSEFTNYISECIIVFSTMYYLVKSHYLNLSCVFMSCNIHIKGKVCLSTWVLEETNMG